MPSPCPSDDSLRRLGDEGLEPDAFVELDRHVVECPGCQARLGALGRWISTWASLPGRRLHAPPADFPSIAGFKLEAELGRGAMGVVFLARQEEVGRLVALKVLPGGDPRDPRPRGRWLQEARAVASVRHPNIVQLHGWGEADGLLYLVMEYLPGGSLKERASGPLDPREAAATMQVVALAVEHIHRRGVLHLDLKPSNILLDQDHAGGAGRGGPTPKLADFGLSRPWADYPGAEASVAGPRGTPPYMAPEQVKGIHGDFLPTTDVYALGATLYHLLTGRPPFQGVSDVEIMEQVLRQEPVAPRRLVPRIPADLETVVLKCLEKSPERRYPSAAAVAEDLERWLAGRPIAARPISLAERGCRWARRKPGLASALAALAATILVSTASLLLLYRRAVADRVEADRNFAVVSSLLLRLEHQALDDLVERGLENGYNLDATLALLKEQVEQLRKIRPIDPDVLLHWSMINGTVANQLRAVARYEEAWTLMRECVDVLSECLERGEAGEVYILATADALLGSARVGRETRRLDEGLKYLDQASLLVQGSRGDETPIHVRALALAAEYQRLGEEFELSGDRERSACATRGRRRLLDFLLVTRSDRPDQILSKACVLSDDGDEAGARALVDGLAASGMRYIPPSGWLSQAVGDALQEWAWREARGLIPRDGYGHEGRLDDAAAEGFMDGLERLCDRVGADRLHLGVTVEGLSDSASQLASKQRRSGRLDLAESTADLLSTLGRAMVRSRPDLPASHILLAESHAQEAKNAWRRDDLAGVRRGLESAVGVIQAALLVAPDDRRLNTRLKSYVQKLAGVPAAADPRLAVRPGGGTAPPSPSH